MAPGSLKKFYRCLPDNNIVSTETYNRVLKTLKNQIDCFVEDAEKRAVTSFQDDASDFENIHDFCAILSLWTQEKK